MQLLVRQPSVARTVPQRGRWQVAGTTDWPVAAQQQPSSAGASPVWCLQTQIRDTASRGRSCCLL